MQSFFELCCNLCVFSSSNTLKALALEHQERREGSDPKTARQPGRSRQGAKVSPETGTMRQVIVQRRLPFFLPISICARRRLFEPQCEISNRERHSR